MELSGVEVADLAAVRVLRLNSNGDGNPSHNGLGHELLDLWTVEKFMDRLRAIRGLYEERCIVGSRAAALWVADPLLDPWCDPSLSEIWRRSVKDPQNSAKLLHWAGPWAEATMRGTELPGASLKKSQWGDAAAAVMTAPAAPEAAMATGQGAPEVAAQAAVVAPVSTVPVAPVQCAVPSMPGSDTRGDLIRHSSIETDGSLESRVLVSSDTSNGAGCSQTVTDDDSHKAIGVAANTLQKIIDDLRNDQKLPEDPGGFDLRASIIERLEAQNAELQSGLARVEEQLKVRNKSLAKFSHSVVPALTAGNLMQHESNGSLRSAEICRSFPARAEWMQPPDCLPKPLQFSALPPRDGIPVIVQMQPVLQKPPPVAAPDGLSVSVRRLHSPPPAADVPPLRGRMLSPSARYQQTPPRSREREDILTNSVGNGSSPDHAMLQKTWPFCNNGGIPSSVSPQRICVATRSDSPTFVAVRGESPNRAALRSESPSYVAVRCESPSFVALRGLSPTAVTRSGTWEASSVSAPSVSAQSVSAACCTAPSSPGTQRQRDAMSSGRCRVGVQDGQIQSPGPGSLRLSRAGVCESLSPGPGSLRLARAGVKEITASPVAGSLSLPRASSMSNLSGVETSTGYQWAAGLTQTKLNRDMTPNRGMGSSTPVRLRVNVGTSSAAAAGQPPPRVQLDLQGSVRVPIAAAAPPPVRGVLSGVQRVRSVSPGPGQARGVSPMPSVRVSPGPARLRCISPGAQIRTFTPVRRQSSANRNIPSVQRQRSSEVQARLQGSER